MRRKTSLALTIPLLVGSVDLQAKKGGIDPIQSHPLIHHAKKPLAYCKRGIASWYGKKFHGRPTASGERFNRNELTAAHASLPLGTLVKVTNLKNGRSIVVKVNDRLPCRRRIIDLSYAAAYRLGLHKMGLAPVEVRVPG
ncbi:MAG: septal ring lytic transglycosylase RlpA family protein [Methylohalobius sp.]|nr:septal ring lytic transglycosylase RlpA family protein [Methylohalobius sp.]